MSTMVGEKCCGCGKGDPTMQCPKCRELGLPPAYFCEQSCFQKSWKNHRSEHKKAPEASISTMSAESLMMYNFTGPLRPGKITPMKLVPKDIGRPDYADHPQGHSLAEKRDTNPRPTRLRGEDVEGMRTVCRLAREVLDLACAAVKPGVTADQIDKIVHDACVERKSYPSPLNYFGFPKSVCTSVNEVICHGIPDNRAFEEGDIVNIDVTLYHNGYHGDLNETVFAGKPSEESLKLVLCAYECLWEGVNLCKPGAFYKNIANGISTRAKEDNFAVVKTYCGHGIHKLFHTSPSIPHYANNRATGCMELGHTFTIEPMINVGSSGDVLWPDNWTAATPDGKRSAQFEETMMIVEDGM